MASNFTFSAARPVAGTKEIWVLRNDSGGWFHPTHIHLIDFKILDRNGRPPFPYELGPKDVAYVGEGETVAVRHQDRLHAGAVGECEHVLLAAVARRDASLEGGHGGIRCQIVLGFHSETLEGLRQEIATELALVRVTPVQGSLPHTSGMRNLMHAHGLNAKLFKELAETTTGNRCDRSARNDWSSPSR